MIYRVISLLNRNYCIAQCVPAIVYLASGCGIFRTTLAIVENNPRGVVWGEVSGGVVYIRRRSWRRFPEPGLTSWTGVTSWAAVTSWEDEGDDYRNEEYR